MIARFLSAVPFAAAGAALCAFAGTALAAPEVYVLDPVHSQVSFEARHMGMTTQRGRFMKSAGTVSLDLAAMPRARDRLRRVAARRP